MDEDDNSQKPVDDKDIDVKDIDKDVPVFNEPTQSAPEAPEEHSEPAEVKVGPHSSKIPGRLAAALLVFVLVVAAVGIYHVANRRTTSSPPASRAALTTAASQAPSQVDITSAGFVPSTISVNVGQAVVWTNQDTAAHTVASDPYPSDNALPSLNSVQKLSTNDSYTYIFNQKGTYTYHDNLNLSLEGSVIVK